MTPTPRIPATTRRGLRPRFSIVSLIPTVYAPAFLLAVGQGVLIPVLPVFAKDEFLATEVFIGLAVGAKHLGTLRIRCPRRHTRLAIRYVAHDVSRHPPIRGGGDRGGQQSNFTLLFVARFAAGASFAFWMISRHAFIAGAVPTRHRGKALSLYGGVGRIAAIIGPILGGVLAEYVDIRAPFYVQAVIAVLTAILVVYAMKRTGGDNVDPQGHRNVVASIGTTMVAHRHDFMTAGFVR